MQVIWKTLRNWVDLELAKANVISVSAKSDKVKFSLLQQMFKCKFNQFAYICQFILKNVLHAVTTIRPFTHRDIFQPPHLTTIKKQLLQTFFIHRRKKENLRSSSLSFLSTYLISRLLPLSEPTSLGGLFLLKASSSPLLSPSPCFLKAPSDNCCWINSIYHYLSLELPTHSLLFEFPLSGYKTKQLNSSTVTPTARVRDELNFVYLKPSYASIPGLLLLINCTESSLTFDHRAEGTSPYIKTIKSPTNLSFPGKVSLAFLTESHTWAQWVSHMP